jgi:hypothetical protein
MVWQDPGDVICAGKHGRPPDPDPYILEVDSSRHLKISLCNYEQGFVHGVQKNSVMRIVVAKMLVKQGCMTT